MSSVLCTIIQRLTTMITDSLPTALRATENRAPLSPTIPMMPSAMLRSSRKIILHGALGLCVFVSSLGAVVSVSTGFVDNTGSSPASTTTGDTRKQTGDINGTSASLNSIGETSTLGYRFSGANSGRAGNANNTAFNQTVTQSIDVSVTWTITADPGETYNFSIDPEFNAVLVVAIVGGGSTDDRTEIGNLTAALSQNSNPISTTGLDFTGDSNNFIPGNPGGNARNVKTLSEFGSMLFTGLTGSNTFELSYSGDLIANWDKVDQNTGTANAVLWGMDGISPDSNTDFNSDWDEYSKSDVPVAASDDGLFLQGTLEVIPEPAASGLILALAGLTMAASRRRR